MKKFTLLFVAFVSISVFLTASALAAEPIKIGVFQPLTGAFSGAGNMQLKAIQLAHKLKGSVLGSPIELVLEDNKSDNDEARNSVYKLASKEVNAIIGSYNSTLTFPASIVTELLQVPLIVPSCTHPIITQDKKTVFRTCFSDVDQSRAAVDYIFNVMKARKAAVMVNIVDEYATSLGFLFNAGFVADGGTIATTVAFAPSDKDLSEKLKFIIESKPDVLYLPTHYNLGVNIIKQARKLGAKFPIFCADAMFSSTLPKDLGPDAEGLTLTTMSFMADAPTSQMSKEQKHFLEAWKKEYGDLTPSTSAACAYDAYMALISAIESKKSADRGDIVAGMEELSNLPSVTGPITINSDHNSNSPVIVVTIKNGKTVITKTYKNN
ncbi:MAG: ABC transporter substrate-binding protein [Synergistaceae bacterium]|nr:ABC transporter substrate-binding protein [Synergistaceae bacterium]